MTTLWQPWRLGDLVVPNRIVRSATWEGLADEQGRPLPGLEALLARIAAGGAGLVVVGFSFVDPAGKALTGQTGIHADDLLPGLAALARAIAREGARSAIQIGHCGPQLWPVLAGQGLVPEAPSATPEGAAALSEERIQALIQVHARAAWRAREAGFDSVQLHAAHGYLLSAFLSPLANRRSDRWGGSLENRARLPLEVVAAARAAVGPGFPLWAKWNCQDFVPGGLSEPDSLEAAARAAAAGLDALEVSGGCLAAGPLGPTRGPDAPEGYFAEAAARFARRLPIPVGSVGGVRTPSGAQALFDRGLAFAALSRPLIRQPDLPLAWRADPAARALCSSCNRCFLPGLRGKGVACMARGRAPEGA